jgi:hypothetical protein
MALARSEAMNAATFPTSARELAMSVDEAVSLARAEVPG